MMRTILGAGDGTADEANQVFSLWEIGIEINEHFPENHKCCQVSETGNMAEGRGV